MIEVAPELVLREVAAAISQDCLSYITVIGSLAAGYHFFRQREGMPVRTKDVDFVLSPRFSAVAVGKDIAERLLNEGWEHRQSGKFSLPGTATTSERDLPAIRLTPPEPRGWFVEILTVPESGDHTGRHWKRVELSTGHFGIPAFRFLALTVYRPIDTDFGIRYARPELMALANLLEHQEISSDVMSSPIDGKKIKRSNKDLGRVLAIARLSDDAVQNWPTIWREALRDKFPNNWKDFAGRTGDGIRALLDNESDLEQAMWSNNSGLLASDPTSLEELLFTGKRLLQDAIQPVESLQ